MQINNNQRAKAERIIKAIDIYRSSGPLSECNDCPYYDRVADERTDSYLQDARGLLAAIFLLGREQ